MDKLQKLIARNDVLLKDMRALADKETLTDEDVASYEAMEAEHDENEKEIARLQKLADLEAKAKAPVNEPVKSNPVEVNEPVPRPYKTLVGQLRDIKQAAAGYVTDELRKVQNAYGGTAGVGEDGGFAIQTDFAGAIMESAAKAGQILPMVDTYTVTDGHNAVKWVDIEETDISSTVFGGVRVYWAAEAASALATHPKLSEKEMKLEKLLGFAYATYELEADSSFVNELYNRAFRLAIQRALEAAIVSGDGVGKPLGFLNSGALVTVAKETGQKAATITWKNLSAIYHRLLNKTQGVWIAHPDAHEQFDFLEFPVGTGGVPVYLPATLQGSVDTLRGKPIVESDHCSELGAAGDICYIEPSQYMLALKGGVDAASSIHVQFLTAENCFRFIFRANGMPKRSKPLTIKNSSKPRSHYIALAARS